MSRPDLLALNAESVAALSNVGLVKRAQKDIEAGRGPAIDEDPAGVVTGTFDDGVVARIEPGKTLKDAACSCGAATVCRHRVAVVLGYGAWHASKHGAPAEVSTVDAWTHPRFADERLLELVGKRVMARAQAIEKASIVIELEEGEIPTAKLPTCAVRFHARRDLAFARCDCRAQTACEHVVLAVWAFRAADERALERPTTIELGKASGGVVQESGDALDEALTLAEHVIVEGVAHLGPSVATLFAQSRTALAKSGFLWPQTIVDDLEMTLEAYRARSTRYRTAEVVELCAGLAARLRASRQGGDLPRRFVLGSDEALVTPLDHVRLVALGARVTADATTRDVSVYLADPDTGLVLVASKRFVTEEGKEPEEGPDLAGRVLTGNVRVGVLARGQLVSRAVKRQANRSMTLTASRTGQTSVVPSGGEWSSLPKGLLCSDFGELGDALRAEPPRLLRPRVLAARMRVLTIAEGGVASLAYRRGEQELIATLHDAQGTRVRPVRRHQRTAPFALDTLARALDGPVAPRFVAGDVSMGASGLEIDPTAIVTDRVWVPDLERERGHVDDLPEPRPALESPIDDAMQRASALLEEAAHDGLMRLRDGFAARAREVERDLRIVGLQGCADRFRPLGALMPDSNGAARAWLDAAVRLSLVRDATLAER